MKRLILIDDNEKPQPICYFELFDAIMNTKVYFPGEDFSCSCDIFLKNRFERMISVDCIKEYENHTLPDEEELEYYYNPIEGFFWVDKDHVDFINKNRKKDIINLEKYKTKQNELL